MEPGFENLQSEVVEPIDKTTTPPFCLCLLHIKAHHVQRAGTFEIHAIECEEAFLYEHSPVGDDGIGRRLCDDFDAHSGFDEYAVCVFVHFSGDDESWHRDWSLKFSPRGNKIGVGIDVRSDGARERSYY